MRDFYTVLSYARRAAVRALRSNDAELACRGVAALSVIDENRIDWRDLAWQARDLVLRDPPDLRQRDGSLRDSGLAR